MSLDSYSQCQIVSPHECNVSLYHLVSITEPPGVVQGWQLTHAAHSNSQHMILTHEAKTESRRNPDEPSVMKVGHCCDSLNIQYSRGTIDVHYPAPPRSRPYVEYSEERMSQNDQLEHRV
jgi:hypothetical protein